MSLKNPFEITAEGAALLCGDKDQTVADFLQNRVPNFLERVMTSLGLDPNTDSTADMMQALGCDAGLGGQKIKDFMTVANADFLDCKGCPEVKYDRAGFWCNAKGELEPFVSADGSTTYAVEAAWLGNCPDATKNKVITSAEGMAMMYMVQGGLNELGNQSIGQQVSTKRISRDVFMLQLAILVMDTYYVGQQLAMSRVIDDERKKTAILTDRVKALEQQAAGFAQQIEFLIAKVGFPPASGAAAAVAPGITQTANAPTLNQATGDTFVGRDWNKHVDFLKTQGLPDLVAQKLMVMSNAATPDAVRKHLMDYIKANLGQLGNTDSANFANATTVDPAVDSTCVVNSYALTIAAKALLGLDTEGKFNDAAKIWKGATDKKLGCVNYSDDGVKSRFAGYQIAPHVTGMASRDTYGKAIQAIQKEIIADGGAPFLAETLTRVIRKSQANVEQEYWTKLGRSLATREKLIPLAAQWMFPNDIESRDLMSRSTECNTISTNGYMVTNAHGSSVDQSGVPTAAIKPRTSS